MEVIVEEVIEKGCNLIVVYYLIVFKGLKSLIGCNYVEWVVIQAIKYDIVIYVIYINFDSVYYQGVNIWIVEKLQLENI